MYSQRTQVLLSREQLARVKRVAVRERRSVGSVIRDAVDAYTAPDAAARKKALRDLYALEAPVADWEEMKAEILRGGLGGR